MTWRKQVETGIAAHRRTRPLRFAARAARWYLRSHDNFDYDHETNGERWLVEQVVLPKSVVFDVGANVGEWTAMVKRHRSAAVVHAFEIVPSTAALLRQSAAPGVTVNEVGLLDHEGTVVVHHAPRLSPVSSILPNLHEGATEEVSCAVTTGDRYCSDRGVARIDFLKIDVEGSDHLVLAGFSSMLGRGAVDIVQFEYGMANIVTRFLLEDFYAMLSGVGFVTGKLFPGFIDFRPYDRTHEDFRGPNYVAVRRDRADIVARLSA